MVLVSSTSLDALGGVESRGRIAVLGEGVRGTDISDMVWCSIFFFWILVVDTKKDSRLRFAC